jgi:hypothetical protein
VLVSTNINDIDISDADQAALDFCEDLRTLTEVSEVRVASKKRMGQSLIGCGLQNLKEGCRDADHAKRIALAIIESWEELCDNEES